MKLQTESLLQNRELVPAAVYGRVEKLVDGDKVMVAAIDPAYADGQLLHEHYETPLEWELNCIVVEGRRGDNVKYAAILLPYGKRVNTGSIVRQKLDAKKVSFADLNYVIEKTGMEFGSITPVGLPEDWFILIDEEVFAQETIIIGGGLVSTKIIMSSYILKDLPNVHIMHGLAKE
ncbi:MAG: hypothetical protein IJI46_05410 [Erysipelotrichaceae bacterium]|nr:hypothetical protein [Erysipelotrichaceae bacterium]